MKVGLRFDVLDAFTYGLLLYPRYPRDTLNMYRASVVHSRF